MGNKKSIAQRFTTVNRAVFPNDMCMCVYVCTICAHMWVRGQRVSGALDYHSLSYSLEASSLCETGAWIASRKP